MTVMSALEFTRVNPNLVSAPGAVTDYRIFISDGTTYTGTGGNPSTNVAGTYMKMDSTGAITPLIPVAFTTEDAQDAIGALFADSNSVDFTYDDAGNTETAEVRIPPQPVVTGATKTYASTDNGKYFRRSNSGAAMNDVLPTTPPNGYYVKVQNVETTTAAVLTITAGSGATIGETGASSSTIKYGCRQTFVYDSAANVWRFDAGNTNLLKTYTGAVPGDLLTLLDTAAVGTAKATAAQVAAASALATTSLQGAMSAADKITVTNLWYDVTNYGVSTGNTGAANVAALQALVTAAGSGAHFFFPNTGANYPMVGTITISASNQTFMGAGMRSSVLFVGNTTQDLFILNDGVNNCTFQDLGFWTTATATAGSVWNAGTVSGTGNAQFNIYRCGMESFGGNFFNGVLMNGSNGGEVCFIEDCVFNAFRNWGIGLVGNTSTPATFAALTVQNCLMNGNINGTSGAVAGIYVQQCGALQIVNCDIIQCTNNLLASPITSSGQVIASILAINTFFDSAYGSCVKLGGTQPIVRCKFTACYMTLSAQAPAGVAAFECSNTAANAPAGIDLIGCSFFNTFNNANATNGILLSNVADILIQACRVAGWPGAGVSVTPVTPAGTTRLTLLSTSIGPTGAIKGNGTGLLLNAGATTYGSIQVDDCSFPVATAYGVANTTNVTDNSSVVNSQKTFSNNVGLAIAPGPNPAAQVLAATTTYVTPAFSVPANGLRVGTKVRFTINVSNAATLNNTTILGKAGTAGTTADTTTVTTAATTGTAAVGAAEIVVEMTVRSVGAAGVIVGKARFISTGGFGGTATTQAAVLATATVNTTAVVFFGVAITASAANVITVQECTAEVVSQ